MPVAMDLVTSAHQRLSAYLPFQALVLEGLIGTDAADTATDAEKLAAAWLFQGLDDEGRPFRDPEGSGTSVVVLSENTEWTGPNRHNTAHFPALQMLIYMDSTRAEAGAPTSLDARRKLKHVARILDRCFHLVGNLSEDHAWPGLDVHSCVRATGLDIRDVPGTQSATVRGEYRYEALTD